MDYIAGSGLSEDRIAGLVDGIARGCRAHRMALAGGETAEMPGLYRAGTYDLAGTIVGVVEEKAAIHGEAIRAGDLLLGYASTGLHTNGYTLARRIVFERMGLQLGDPMPDQDRSVADVLLDVHRSYFRSVMPAISELHGLAHITGGGIPGNLARILPPGCGAVVDPTSWEPPPLFATLQQEGGISNDEMREVFNLGVGLIAVLPPEALPGAQAAAAADGVATWLMGEIRAGGRTVRFARP
jgi:phosphoribosylformylglycinamidine cyclo-ligase